MQFFGSIRCITYSQNCKLLHPRQSLCQRPWDEEVAPSQPLLLEWLADTRVLKKNWLSSRQYPSQEMADQQLLEAETPSQVLVLSGITQAAFLTFSNGFLLIRSCVAVAYEVLHDPEGTVFYASVSFHFQRLEFSLLSRLCWNRRRNSNREG